MKPKTIIFIIFFALLIRIIFFIGLKPWDKQALQYKVVYSAFAGDATGYQEFAEDILNTGITSSSDILRTPGYPLFLAFVYFLFGANVLPVLLLQILLDVGTVVIVYFLAKEIFESRQIPIIAALLYSISFVSACFTVRLLTDIPFTFVFALSILIFIKALKKNRLWLFGLSAFVMGIAAYVRSISQYFPMVIFIVLAFQKGRPIQKACNILIFLIVFFITISPWQFRNLHTFGYYSLSGAPGFGASNEVAVVKANIEKKSLGEAHNELIGNSLQGVRNPFEISKIHKKKALEYISRHPFRCIFFHLKGSCNTFISTAKGDIIETLGLKSTITGRLLCSERIIDRIVRTIKSSRKEYFLTPILATKNLLEYILFAIGLVMMCTSRDKKIYAILFLLIMLYFTVLVGPCGYHRYKIPIIPFYLVMSAKGIFEIFKFIRNKKAPPYLGIGR